MAGPVTSHWQPYREPLRTTLLRTGIIAIIAGAVLARFSHGVVSLPAATLLALWPSFGGHWIEIWFVNSLRLRLPTARVVQVAARIGVWFIAGIFLTIGMDLTARALGIFSRAHWSVWWRGGLAFIGIELLAHLALQFRGRASFYNGKG